MNNPTQAPRQAHPVLVEQAQYGGTDYHSTRDELARQVAQEHAQARPQSD